MSVEVRRVDDADDWDRYVERSPTSTFFHRSDVLELQADHSGATLYPLAGFKGEEPAGVFPLFSLRKGPLTGVFSPPPSPVVSYLGPATLNQEKLSRRKAERRLRSLVEGALEWVIDEADPSFTQVTTPVGFGDVRPFKWGGYDVIPQYTYYVDLTTADEESGPLSRAPSDARRTSLSSNDEENVIEEGGRDALERIVAQVERRSRGRYASMPSSFVRDLAERLPDGSIQAYTCRVDGEYAGGIVALEHGDVVYRWVSAVEADVDTHLPINDLLDWEVMQRARERGRTRYDLVGASDHQMDRYGTKFDRELQTFYRIQSGSRVVNTLANTYRKLSGSRWFGTLRGHVVDGNRGRSVQ